MSERRSETATPLHGACWVGPTDRVCERGTKGCVRLHDAEDVFAEMHAELTKGFACTVSRATTPGETEASRCRGGAAEADTTPAGGPVEAGALPRPSDAPNDTGAPSSPADATSTSESTKPPRVTWLHKLDRDADELRAELRAEGYLHGPRWRAGRSIGRTLYVDGRVVGMVDTPELAEAIVEAMNAAEAKR